MRDYDLPTLELWRYGSTTMPRGQATVKGTNRTKAEKHGNKKNKLFVSIQTLNEQEKEMTSRK